MERIYRFYKASKTIIPIVVDLKQAFLNGAAATVDYIIDFLDISYRRHLLEKEKGKNNYSPTILFDALSLSYDGEAMSVTAKK